MANCELCGKETKLIRAEVEGIVLNVCQGCAKHGKAIRAPQAPKPSRRRTEAAPEIVEELVTDYSDRIRKARERKGMTQEEFAKMLNEKESIVQKIENGTFRPTIDKAKKFQKILNISLIDATEETPVKIGKSKSEALTIGDILKVKK